MPVFTEHSPASIALVQDIILDPENGKLLAFVIKGNHIIVPLDIERLNAGLYIRDQDCIMEQTEVLRVSTVASRNIYLIGAHVITEKNKTYLGRVVDYEFDTRIMVLTKIYVEKLFVFFHFQEKIIPFHSIVKILPKHIIVKDSNVAREQEKIMARSGAFAS